MYYNETQINKNTHTNTRKKKWISIYDDIWIVFHTERKEKKQPNKQ